MSFSKLLQLYNHYQYPVLKHFHHQKNFSHTSLQLILGPFHNRGNQLLAFCLYSLAFSKNFIQMESYDI